MEKTTTTTRAVIMATAVVITITNSGILEKAYGVGFG